MNELNEQMEKFCRLSTKIDDKREWVVHGANAAQHHMEEVDCHRRLEMAINDEPIS